MQIIRPKFKSKPRPVAPVIQDKSVTLFMNDMLLKSKGKLNEEDAKFIAIIKHEHQRWVADGRPQSNGEMS